MKMLDFFDVINKPYAGLEEVQFFSGLKIDEANYLLNQLIIKSKYKGYLVKEKQIPMIVLTDYFNIDIYRVNRYHEELEKFSSKFKEVMCNATKYTSACN